MARIREAAAVDVSELLQSFTNDCRDGQILPEKGPAEQAVQRARRRHVAGWLQRGGVVPVPGSLRRAQQGVVRAKVERLKRKV
jgi:hypothetical protein